MNESAPKPNRRAYFADIPANWDSRAAAYRREHGPILDGAGFVSSLGQKPGRKPATPSKREPATPTPTWTDRAQPREGGE